VIFRLVIHIAEGDGELKTLISMIDSIEFHDKTGHSSCRKVDDVCFAMESSAFMKTNGSMLQGGKLKRSFISLGLITMLNL
jgi:hypothetical protein